MRMNFQTLRRVMFSVFVGAGTFGAARPVAAHCDGMDGPVVKAAQQAFQSGDVNLVLIWVQPRDEAEIKAAFTRAVGVRKLSAEARELADQYFFETLVRVHRAGEGAPYTGLKPAGRDLGPAIPAADQAIETGSDEAVSKLITDTIRAVMKERFKAVIEARKFDSADLAQGRRFVAAYVTFLHYVEGLYQVAQGTGVHGDAVTEEPAHSKEGGHGTAHEH